MTPLDHAKAVVERSRAANGSGPIPPGTGTYIQVSPAEAEAIGRLVAWAECQQAMIRYGNDREFLESDLSAALKPLGFEGGGYWEAKGFLQSLRDAALGDGVGQD